MERQNERYKRPQDEEEYVSYKRRVLENERGSTRSYRVENWLWKSLWNCREADCGINGYCKLYDDKTMKALSHKPKF